MQLTNGHTKVYLFIHAIWAVKDREPLLTKPIRTILFAHLQKNAEEKGVRVLAVDGVDDHLHCLIQMLPAQNLTQVVNSLKTEGADWINESRFIKRFFEWQEGYAAYSVSPSGVKQVIDYLPKQEEYHKTKTLESELEVFDKIQF
ncbi:MAG: IS200/IS605 family transposase [Chitinophagaceae bacterium]